MSAAPMYVDLGDNLWMPHDGFVPGYNLVLANARQLGLTLADVGLILQIMRLQAEEVLAKRAPRASLRTVTKECRSSYSFVRSRVKYLAGAGLLTIIKHRGLRDAYDFAPLYQRCWCYASPRAQEKSRAQIAALPPAEEEEEQPTQIPYPTRPRGRPRKTPVDLAPVPMNEEYQAAEGDPHHWYWTQQQTDVFRIGQQAGFPAFASFALEAGPEAWLTFVNDASEKDLHRMWLARIVVARAAVVRGVTHGRVESQTC